MLMHTALCCNLAVNTATLPLVHPQAAHTSRDDCMRLLLLVRTTATATDTLPLGQSPYLLKKNTTRKDKPAIIASFSLSLQHNNSRTRVKGSYFIDDTMQQTGSVLLTGRLLACGQGAAAAAVSRAPSTESLHSLVAAGYLLTSC